MPDIFHFPATVAGLRPPRPSSVITEMANFQRAHHDELLPYHKSLTGEDPSMTGSFAGDEWKSTFAAMQIAGSNGYAFLGTMQGNAFRRAYRYAWKRNTGIAMGKMVPQWRQLQITHQPQPEEPEEPSQQ